MKKSKTGNIVPYKQDAEFFFRVGMRYADRRAFGRALKYLNKAVEMEPFNADYQFNLGCILAELKESDKSNEVFLGIVRYIDPTLAECYFGLGCNYFDLGDFKKSREYFEKYIYFNPDGQFIDEAHDILYYIQIYDGAGNGNGSARLSSKLAAEGKKLIDRRDYAKARSKLEKAIEIDPGYVLPRNELSVLCFLTGEVDMAIRLAHTVLKIEPGNVFANCNLAVYYYHAGKTENFKNQMKILPKLEIRNREEFLKLLETFFEVDECNGAQEFLLGYMKKHGSNGMLESLLKYGKTGRDVKSVIKKVLELKNCGNTRNGNLKNAVPNNARFTTLGKIKWRKEWEAVIDCALQNKEFIYKGTYKEELKNIWMNYISSVYPDKVPVIRKREIWAAALEFIYCNLHLIRVSKKKLAEKYKVSPSSITNKLKDFRI